MCEQFIRKAASSPPCALWRSDFLPAPLPLSLYVSMTHVQRRLISGSLKSSGGFDKKVAGRKGSSEKNKEKRAS